MAMLLADTMAWVFAIAGLLLALPGLWLLCRGLWPGTVDRTRQDCGKGLLFPLLVGIPIAGLTIVAVGVVSKGPPPWNGILSILVVSSALLFAANGIAGLATVVGQRLPSPADAERPWKATIRGGIVLELAFLVPVLGWFVLLPLSLIIGAGATLRSIIAGFRHGANKGEPKAEAGSTAATATSPLPLPSLADAPLEPGALGAST
jgi:hypothetical protein